ncbi:serine hydrolase [Luteimonas aquatica]|uniref:serine hydrolase n=1 Tax=Luteimonas aquatica TaxID=450364 RepID=UPI001F5AA80A|nr:serine hydrolase [Luteimonas aquatica]
MIEQVIGPVRGRMRRGLPVLAAVLLTALSAGASPRPAGAQATPGAATAARAASLRGLSEADRRWVESTFAGLDLDRKAAQLVFVKTEARPRPADAPPTAQLLAQVRELGIGGLVLSRSEFDTVVPYLDGMQAAAAVPLLVSGDFERSVGFRVDEGTVQLPGTMAIGALSSGAEEAARFAGEVTARESRALGVQWVLAPVADVNVNPANPVINTRSFGEEPERVGKLVAAFIQGAHAARTPVMTSVKHFPGHGDTAVDSHYGLPTLAGDRARLRRVELVPFRAAIAAGVDSVMLGHLQVPALDPSQSPATLSRPIATGLLRDELGFRGLAVTDAMDMRGVAGVWVGAAAVRAIAAGADVVLMPPDPRVAAQSIARAVREGQLPQARLDEAVLRVLAAKARMGLHRQRMADAVAARGLAGRSDDQARADAIARDAITLVRNAGDVLPLPEERHLRILHLVVASDGMDDPADAFETELEARRIPADTVRVAANLPAPQREALLARARDGYTHVLVSLYLRGGARLDESQAALLNALGASGVPNAAIVFGSPYVTLQLPQVPALLCAWGPWATNQRAAMQALLGESAITGRLPVTLPGVAKVGEGLRIPRRALALETPADPRKAAVEAGFRPDGLDAVARVLDEAVASGAFPGGVIAVGHRGRLAMLRPFGRQTYAVDAPAVAADTLYDLASLTKVIATTTMAMMLVDQGRLDLDARVASYLPRFVDGPGQASDKDAVTVRQLLTHSAGLQATAQLYRDTQGRQAFLERIEAMPLAYRPGTESRYSDLGVILLGEILERVSGVPLDTFAREQVFEPLDMRQTRFFPEPPPSDVLARIAPTERDPWRGRVVRGDVHDENAYAMGGVAPHAGLFSTAGDLARFAQMLLYGGVLDDAGGARQRIVSHDTVALFTRRDGAVADSTRALGWDTRSPEGSSAGSLFSADAFGHTGFTGTSLWIDPERELFVVLLTNRVHPTRENNRIREVRPAVADAVVRALAAP